MDQSPSQPSSFEPDKNGTRSGRNGHGVSNDTKDASDHRMVADQLMAALSSGDLQHLAEARKAFLNEPSTGSQREPADLETQLERRARTRALEQAVVADDDLRAEEEALKQAELELQ